MHTTPDPKRHWGDCFPLRRFAFQQGKNVQVLAFFLPPRCWFESRVCFCLTLVGACGLLILTSCSQRNSGSKSASQSAQTSTATSDSQSPASALREMRKAIAQEDWKRAATFADTVLISCPEDVGAISDVARVKALNGDPRSAALLSVEAANVGGLTNKKRVEFAIAALVQVGEIYPAIDLMQRYLKVNPSDDSVRRTLVGFLGEVDRYDLIPQHMQRLIKDRAFDAPLLVVTTENSARRFSRDNASILTERNPDDLRVSLATARQAMVDGDFAKAKELLERIVKRHPRFAPAHAMLGQALVAVGSDGPTLIQWKANAPAATRDFADYWSTVADIAESTSDMRSAARAYWEATRCDPNSSTAWSRLVRSLERLRLEGDAPFVTDDQLDDMRQRIASLLDLRRRYYDFSGGKRKSQRDAARVAETLFDLGRYWEAEAWSAVAASLSDDPYEGLSALRERIVARLSAERDWIGRKHHPALLADLSSLPLTEKSNSQQPNKKRYALVPAIESIQHIKFANEANTRGLADVGANNNPLGKYLSVIRTTGIGAGAIDFDLDGWSDVVVMGAGGTFAKDDSQPNVLMRNLHGKFADITASVGVTDTNFGQGVVVGDYNEDGFADLLFANLGMNRLFRNNGDGTFSDRTNELPNQGPMQWSTSGAFADFDGNGIADLVVANYCRLDEPFAKVQSASGKLGSDSVIAEKELLSFHPLDYPSQADCFWMAKGDGGFEDQSDRWMKDTSFGRGLGVLCGQLTDGHFGVLIANDMSANTYFHFPLQGASIANDSASKLVDSAAARGLAVNSQTLTQASMGIAQSDFDGDGDLDSYVTGFAREHNILYEQIAAGLWQDRTHLIGLIEPTHMMVAFGTDAIDVDNDGIDEILVTNGGIGDAETTPDVPYQQPMQLFRRSPEGKFDEMPIKPWGDYFAQDHVGRSLVSADFDRDGRVDALITHNYEPVALLMNRTQADHHFVRFGLVGTEVSRDGVGAIVRFRAGGRQRTLWSVSGDGYLCSNERILHAGIGKNEQVEQIEVTWRDGSVQSFGDLSADKLYLLIQGQKEAFSID